MTVAEIQEVVREAAETHGTVTARGFGTYAREIPRGARVIDMRGMDGMVEYDPADLTVTIEAGCRLDALDRMLGEHGQWLPADVPSPETTTVGGMIATGLSGARRETCGTLRDQLIGIEWVGGEGQVLRSGGRVVKNVAGYDLMKLHVGARGRFGVVTRATFKVRPRAAGEATSGMHTAATSPAGDPNARTSRLLDAIQRSLDPQGVFRS